jgi:hypothetical protein
MRISVQFVKMGPLVSDCYSLAVSLVERRGLSDGEGYLSIGYHRHSRATQKLRETKSSRLWLFIFLTNRQGKTSFSLPPGTQS